MFEKTTPVAALTLARTAVIYFIPELVSMAYLLRLLLLGCRRVLCLRSSSLVLQLLLHHRGQVIAGVLVLVQAQVCKLKTVCISCRKHAIINQAS